MNMLRGSSFLISLSLLDTSLRSSVTFYFSEHPATYYISEAMLVKYDHHSDELPRSLISRLFSSPSRRAVALNLCSRCSIVSQK